MLRLVIFILACVVSAVVQGQQQARMVVVADEETREPVSHASLYAKEDGHFRSCITDEQGVARVAFAFRRLTVSHLNYEQRVLRQLADTIWLKPKFLTKAEVVVTNKEPEWIRRCLKRVAKTKDRHYYSHEGCEAFTYDTQSLGTNSIYRFHLSGQLLMKNRQHKRYAIVADSAAIVADDTTRLTDTANLRRMLYEDFMVQLDEGFIRQHRFFHNADYQGRTPDEVELRFRRKSKADDSDRGWLVVDTARCVVLSAYRYTGTKVNRQELIAPALYAMARLMGYHITKWMRDYRVQYAERPDGTLYPAEVRYKTYFANTDSSLGKREKEFHEMTGGGFPNMEATLTLRPGFNEPGDFDSWLELPPSWYVAIHFDDERQLEMQLSNLPASFSIFDE